jgi:Glycosyltransferase family 87
VRSALVTVSTVAALAKRFACIYIGGNADQRMRERWRREDRRFINRGRVRGPMRGLWMNQSPWRAAAAACIVAGGTLLVAAILAFGMRRTNPGARDFIEYWAAEQQLVHGRNPYDGAAILKLESAEGFREGRAELWYSPPAVLFLALPLGFVSAKTAMLLWGMILFILYAASVWLIWILNGKPPTLLHLFGFLFAPALICLQAGQISIFFLLGVVLFLLLYDSWPFLAGMALVPCALKPHLFMPFAVAVLLWVLSRKAYGLVVGFCSGLLAGTGIAYFFDPDAWPQYFAMMRSEGLLNAYAPTMGETFRDLIHHDAAWLQFVPEVAACAWAPWFFWTRRERWSWMDQGLLVLLVSVLCRPYGWVFDEAVLLPAVMTGMFRARECGRSLIPFAVAGVAALVQMGQMTKIASPLYLWTAPAWLACYLYATMKTRPVQGISGATGAR